MNRAEQTKQTLTRFMAGATAPWRGPTRSLAAIKTRLIYGEVYAEEKLSAKLRELVILAVAATNQTMDEVKRHTAAALAAGVRPEEVPGGRVPLRPLHRPGQGGKRREGHGPGVYGAWGGPALESGQTVTEESRLADGIAAQKSIFGDHIDAMRSAAPANQKNIQDYLSAYCFGDFYTRKFLTIPERELLTFAVLSAQGAASPR